MKKYYLLALLPLLIGCGPKDKPADPLPPEPDPEPKETKTCTVDFRNGGFTTSSFENANTQASFIEWFNNHENGEGLLRSIDYDDSTYYTQMNYIGNEGDPNRFSTMILGSQNKTGELSFELNYAISKITCTVQAYVKYISYSDSYSVDTESVFYIDTDSIDLSIDNYDELPEEKEFSVTKRENETSFTISSDGSRVFVHQMIIEYFID